MAHIAGMSRRLRLFWNRVGSFLTDLFVFTAILLMWPLLGWWLSNVVTVADPTTDAKDVYYMLLKRWLLFWMCASALITVMVLWG